MKVLHVIPWLDPVRGGPSVVLPQLAGALSARGVQVDIATTAGSRGAGNNPQESVSQDGGFRAVYFPRQTQFYTFSWPLTRWLAENVRRYDLVHIHTLFTYPPIPAALFSIRSGVPYIIRPVGDLNRWGMENRRRRLKRASFQLIEKHILGHAAAIHFTSEQECIEAAQIGVQGKPAIVPLGVDLGRFETLPAPETFFSAHPEIRGRQVILFLSRLHEKKGLDLLLRAYADLRSERCDCVLVIAGSGDEGFVSELHRLAHDLHVEDHVIWTGFLEGREKLAALSAADIFVLPSYSENFGLAVVEAMAAGRAVVVSDQVAVSRDVARVGAGLVTACDCRELVAAMSRLLCDPGLRGRLAANGRATTGTHFTSDRMAGNIHAMYERILREGDFAAVT